MPVRPREADSALVQAAEALGVSFRTVKPGDFNNACTDMGDLTPVSYTHLCTLAEKAEKKPLKKPAARKRSTAKKTSKKPAA